MQMIDVLNILHSFALNVGSIVHDTVRFNDYRSVMIDEFMQKVEGWNYAQI